jgi:hypothetical protein
LESHAGGFEVTPLEGEIPPQSSQQLRIRANLYDILTFTGTLKLMFEYLNVMKVSMKAIGTGTPIVSDIDMQVIDFGYILTSQQIVKSFVLENRSHRDYEIRFTPGKVQIAKDLVTDFHFVIEPEFCMMHGGGTLAVRIVVTCSSVVAWSLPLQCHATISRQRLMVFSPMIKGSFVEPILGFSASLIDFSRQFEGASDTSLVPTKDSLEPIHKKLVMRNEAKLSLPVQIDCPLPFVISPESVEIGPGEAVSLDVKFDPAFKSDFVTEILHRKATFSVSDHPRRMNIALKASLTFPNVEFETMELIDFGNLMVNFEK